MSSLPVFPLNRDEILQQAQASLDADRIAREKAYNLEQAAYRAADELKQKQEEERRARLRATATPSYDMLLAAAKDPVLHQLLQEHEGPCYLNHVPREVYVSEVSGDAYHHPDKRDLLIEVQCGSITFWLDLSGQLLFEHEAQRSYRTWRQLVVYEGGLSGFILHLGRTIIERSKGNIDNAQQLKFEHQSLAWLFVGKLYEFFDNVRCEIRDVLGFR